MDNENETIPEIVQETENETVETVEETVELSVEDKLAKAQAEANKWRRIAQKNQKPQADVSPHITTDPQIAEELKLIARGLSDEEIEQAKVVAKGKGISLVDATKDALFLTYQSDLKEKAKREAAKLGASKGSGETQQEITGVESGSSREQHMAAFKKING